MIVLGIFGPGANASSALLKDGKLIALIEEERLNRIKTSPNGLPFLSVKKCLEIGKIDISQVDYIAWGWECNEYKKIMKKNNSRIDQNSRNYLFNTLNSILYNPELIVQKFNIYFNKKEFKKFPKITFLPHHKCHAASAVFCTNFKEANILTIDGSGEDICTAIYEYNNNRLKVLKEFKLPHSLGGFYATFTEFLGFTPYMDEGKLMGLAGYGKFSQSIQKKLDKIISFDIKNNLYQINSQMRYDGNHSQGFRFTDQFIKIFGNKRNKNTSALKNNYPDLAFNVQKRLEDIVISLVKFAYKKNGIGNFCLAGGVAMNCKMNGEIIRQDFVKNFFSQPAASDNGASLGAAQYLLYLKKKKHKIKLNNLYYGPQYSNSHVLKVLKESKIKFIKCENIEKKIAKLIINKKIVARFSERMEFGARALGNRSILASPFYKDIREYVNLKVKKRENWRPFCPSVLEEDFHKIFIGDFKPKFMTAAIRIKKKFKVKFPSCVHVDDTVRVQVVSKKDNLKYWKLLREIKKLTGYGIVINTSFNVQGEPVVCSPKDALRTFYSSGIDYLAISDYLVSK